MAGGDLTADLVAVTADDGAAAECARRRRAVLPGAASARRRTLRERHGRHDGEERAQSRRPGHRHRRRDHVDGGVSGGELVLAEVIPVGGNHITFDIARALVTPVDGSRANQNALWHTAAGALERARDALLSVTGGEEGATRPCIRAELRASDPAAGRGNCGAGRGSGSKRQGSIAPRSRGLC